MLELSAAEPVLTHMGKLAAVMVMVAGEVPRDAAVLLIRRAWTLKEHPGQIALPGGRYDSARDRSLWETAVRETQEEVGVVVPADFFAGYLPPVRIAATGYTVLPCVSVWTGRPVVRPTPAEVDAAHWVPFEVLMARRVGGPLDPEFSLAWGVVWGATARIVDGLLTIVEEGGLR